jgi:acetamidase/formamidase
LRRSWLSFALLACCAARAETHRVIGESYYHTFSAGHPVLARVNPGDTIVTKTVDSAGFDYQGIRRTKTHGNPLTGAFYVEGAQPGDALVVRIRRINLNRATGYTGAQVGVKNLPDSLRAERPKPDAVYKGYDYLVPWSIDVAKRTVRHGSLEFAAQPMLGCIGVAPEGDFSPRSGPAGYWGGNIDYNLVREGATVYLPVFHPGALLFFGDGHALQGDGEGVGSGVETSLDVEVEVGLRKQWKLTGPRLENAEHIVSIGSLHENQTLNSTMELATIDMLRWLIEDFGYTASEAHLLLGMQAKYDVITLGGSVGLRVPKRVLRRP